MHVYGKISYQMVRNIKFSLRKNIAPPEISGLLDCLASYTRKKKNCCIKYLHRDGHKVKAKQASYLKW